MAFQTRKYVPPVVWVWQLHGIAKAMSQEQSYLPRATNAFAHFKLQLLVVAKPFRKPGDIHRSFQESR